MSHIIMFIHTWSQTYTYDINLKAPSCHDVHSCAQNNEANIYIYINKAQTIISYIYIYIYLCIDIVIWMQNWVQVAKDIQIHTHIYTHIHTFTRITICKYVCTNIPSYTNAHGQEWYLPRPWYPYLLLG